MLISQFQRSIDIVYNLRENDTESWVLSVLLLYVLTLLIGKLSDKNRLFDLAKHGSGPFYFSLYSHDGHKTLTRFNMLSLLLQMMMSGLLIVLLIEAMNPSILSHYDSKEIFGIGAVFWMGFLLFRSVISALLLKSLGKIEVFSEALNLYFTWWTFFAIYLVPILTFVLFQNMMAPGLAWVILAVMFLIWAFVWLDVVREDKVQALSSIIYFILYLCTLEIGPLIIIFNLLTK